MRLLVPAVCAFLIAVCLAHLPAVTTRMPVDEVRAGMTGIGVTVFEGSDREEFDVRILGVLSNVMGPRRDVIIARLSGGPLANTGVIQGMSGSPVYIDHRLVGAISYSLGSFPKEPIAGITPIDEMVEADANPVAVARVRAQPPWFPATRDTLATLVREAFQHVQPFALRPADVRTFGLPRSEGERLGTLLRPIATPLVLNGFAPQIHDLWATAFTAGGFAPTIGGTQISQEDSGAPLQPGDPIGVGLVRGDLTMAGTGTVTMVDGDRVYAFGHPFYNLGAVRFPMTRARVTTVLPSLALSSKIAAIGAVMGTIDQDRATGVFGTLGPGPKMIPVRLRLAVPDRDLAQTFEFEVIDDRLFTPLLTYTSVLSTFLSWTRELAPTTYSISSTTHLRDHTDVTLQDIYSGQTAHIAAALAIANPLTRLLNNDIASVTLEGIDIDVTAIEEPRTATLERVWLSTPRVRAGDSVQLNVLSRNYRGAELLQTVTIDVPANATGSLQVLVSDATQLRQREAQEGRLPQDADTLEQLILALNSKRQNNRLYVKLLSPKPGAVLKGDAMPSLPPSIMAVLESNQSGSGLRRLQQATLGEWEIRSDHAVSGLRLLTINVEAG